MTSEKPSSVLKPTDWLLIGAGPVLAGLLVFLVVMFGWRAEPESPWGRALAELFFTYPIAALALIILGLPALWKGYTAYQRSSSD